MVRNAMDKTVQVAALRELDSVGRARLNLGAGNAADRVLSDSFSESTPAMRIYNLGQAPEHLHLGVGSQLIYNRQSHEGLFLGALTSERFITVLRLGLRPHETIL